MGARNGTSAALVDEVYRTYRIDERGPMLALLSDNVVFRIEGDPERLPFAGLWHVMPASTSISTSSTPSGRSPRSRRSTALPKGARGRPDRHALAPYSQRRLLARCGQGSPGSHGPPEQRANRRWLTRRYRRPWRSAGKNSSNLLPRLAHALCIECPVA
jgi:hypothetical protein